ncbi:PEP-CTERM sorting domain-containing protein [Desulfosarcina sp.]|nr:PEP-CTERM sorting domain-containing protein [Desulfosarcina sp.]
MKIGIGLLAFAVLLMFTGMEVQADIYTNTSTFSVPNTSGWVSNQNKTPNADGSTTWEFTSRNNRGDDDFYDLPDSYYFSWLNQSPDLAGLQIQSATIWFDNISTTDGSTHDLWVNLLDEVPDNNSDGSLSGDVDYYRDAVTGQANDFDTAAMISEFVGVTELVQYDENDYNATPVDISYTFTGAQLDTLEDYLANSTFGIGLDPDTKYQNDGVYLVINTGPGGTGPGGTPSSTSHTPEPGSIFLLGAGMITLAGWKRRRWSDKIKP